MSMAKKSHVIEHLRREKIFKLLAEKKRIDGRGFNDYRPMTIDVGVIEKANGSARVIIGNTQIIAGVKISVGTPFPDTPNKGLLVVNAELTPISSPYAETGPPSEDVIELARVADRGIRESEMIDNAKLVLVEGEKVLAVFADVSIINVDGNLLDAVSYGVASSLASAKMKKVEVDGDGKVIETDELVPLPIETIPVSITQAKIQDALMVDPTLDEETVMDARITLTSDDRGNICAGQKGIPGSLTPDQIIEASETSLSKGKEIRKIILEAIKDGEEKSKEEL